MTRHRDGRAPTAAVAVGRAQEKEAEELAGALLVPEEKAKIALIKDIAPLVVANRYQVSVEMATWRMKMSRGYAIRERSRRRGARPASRQSMSRADQTGPGTV